MINQFNNTDTFNHALKLTNYTAYCIFKVKIIKNENYKKNCQDS